MKLIIPAVIVCVFATISGCGTALKSDPRDNSSQFEGFPSYKIDRPINDHIEVVVPIGNGKKQQTVTVETTIGDNLSELDRLVTTTKWNIDFEQGQILTSLNTVMQLSEPDVQDLIFEVDEELVSHTDGKSISYQADFSKLESEVSADLIEIYNQVQPQWITQEYHIDELGTLIKTGYKIRPSVIREELLEEILGTDMSSKIDNFEIVEGYGKYDNKKVIVTSYMVNETFPDNGSTVAIKGKGFNLYDAESFIHVFGDFLILVNVSDDAGEIVNMKVQVEHLSDDYTVNGFIRAK